MGKRRYLLGTAAFVGMLVLILDGKTAAQGAYAGVELCIKTVIPSLFPFFVLSNLITGTWLGSNIRLLHPVGRLCKLSEGMESLLVPSFLGGYPVAAQIIGQQWKSGRISKEEAERLLGFCNNAGPSFLFGMAAVMFPERWMPWLLWSIQVLAAVLTARLIPGKPACRVKMSQMSVTVPQALGTGMTSMAMVCGWVVFFRVLIAFLTRWILWLVPPPLQVVVIGIMELSNGCMRLGDITDVGIRFIACCGMLSFGGLCVIMQIASAAQGLSLKWFFYGKLIQTAVSISLAWVFVSGNFFVFGFLALLVPLLFVKSRKSGSIPGQAGV